MSPHQLTLPLPSLGDYVEFHRKRLKLTREALGKRAHLSARTIQKLERGEQTGLSQPSLDSLANALELSARDERRHLDELTRVHIPRPWFPQSVRSEATPDERAMLDDLMPHPAAFCNIRWDVVVANEAYEALFPGRVEIGNAIRWLFAPAGRKAVLNWEAEAASDVSRMRGILAHFGNPAVGIELLAELQHDPDFAVLWLRREVSYDRPVEEPQHINTDSGPVTVTMRLQSMPARLDWLHLCVGVVRPYSGSRKIVSPASH